MCYNTGMNTIGIGNPVPAGVNTLGSGDLFQFNTKPKTTSKKKPKKLKKNVFNKLMTPPLLVYKKR